MRTVHSARDRVGTCHPSSAHKQCHAGCAHACECPFIWFTSTRLLSHNPAHDHTSQMHNSPNRHRSAHASTQSCPVMHRMGRRVLSRGGCTGRMGRRVLSRGGCTGRMRSRCARILPLQSPKAVRQVWLTYPASASLPRPFFVTSVLTASVSVSNHRLLRVHAAQALTHVSLRCILAIPGRATPRAVSSGPESHAISGGLSRPYRPQGPQAMKALSRA